MTAAVDLGFHSGSHIFENLISNENGFLRDKTRLFITHNITYVPRSDYVLVITIPSRCSLIKKRLPQILDNGKIKNFGPYSNVIAENEEFAQYFQDTDISKARQRVFSESDDKESDEISAKISTQLEEDRKIVQKQRAASLKPKMEELVGKEQSRRGTVSLSVYYTYFRNFSMKLVGAGLLMYALLTAAMVGANCKTKLNGKPEI